MNASLPWLLLNVNSPLIMTKINFKVTVCGPTSYCGTGFTRYIDAGRKCSKLAFFAVY